MTFRFAIVVTVVALTVGPPSHADAQSAAAKSAGKVTGEQQRAPSHVDLSKYPPAVRTTIEAETKNATLKHVARETEKGKTQYEVETIANGKSRDLLVDQSGKVIEVEEEIAVDSAPAPVLNALKPRGKILKLERVVRDGVTSYEASVQGTNGKKSSLALDSQGKAIKG